MASTHATRWRCAPTRRFLCLALAAGWLLAGQWAVAQQPLPADGAAFRQKLDAGAFDEALEQVGRAPDGKTRDLWLAQIALAQARADRPEEAVGSLGQMANDSARAAAVEGIRAQAGGQGGGAEADFEALIELIETTVKPESWQGVGGNGAIAPFPTGVYVDASGQLRTLLKIDASGPLDALRANAQRAAKTWGAERAACEESVRRNVPLRKISLSRLQRAVGQRLADGKQPTETMQMLAGLQRIEYVLVYADGPGVVLAGPAGDWTLTTDNRIVSTETGLPVVRLDDLVAVFRHVLESAEPRFGCLIKPRQQALARTQAFLNRSGKQPLRPGQRGTWLAELRGHLGEQDIEVYGLDPRTRAARVMVEADYRMKLIGMGLEEAVPGVQSYLDRIEVPPGEDPPPLGVLRWWFSLDYDSVVANPRRTAFALRGQGMKVLSENERLAADGRRIHTGESEELNRRFAADFTRHFGDLCRKYPVYAELRNLGDLALAAGVIREHHLLDANEERLGCFAAEGTYAVALGLAPQTVETVINHRVIRRKHIIAGVSGGVAVDPMPLVEEAALGSAATDALEQAYQTARPEQPAARWWWD